MKQKRWTIIGRHNQWVNGCTVFEELDPNDDLHRRFFGTIRGFRLFPLGDYHVGDMTMQTIVEEVIGKVRALRTRVDNDDSTVFDTPIA